MHLLLHQAVGLLYVACIKYKILMLDVEETNNQQTKPWVVCFLLKNMYIKWKKETARTISVEKTASSWGQLVDNLSHWGQKNKKRGKNDYQITSLFCANFFFQFIFQSFWSSNRLVSFLWLRKLHTLCHGLDEDAKVKDI